MNTILFALALMVCICLTNIGQAYAHQGHHHGGAGESVGFLTLGGLKLIPYLGVQHGYNDNILLTDANKKSSNFTVLKSALSLQRQRNVSRVALNYGLNKGIVHSSREDDYLDQKVEVLFDINISKRLHTKFATSHQRSHDPRGSTFTGVAVVIPSPDKWHESNGSLSLGYGELGHLEFNGLFSKKRYDNNRSRTRFNDLDTIEGRLLFSYPISSKATMAVESRYRRFNYIISSGVSNLDSREQDFLAGLDWQATAQTSGKVRVGYLLKKFSTGNQKSSGNLGWSFDAQWDPLTYSTVNVSTQSARAESDGIGGYIVTRNASATWAYQWSSRLKHVLSVKFTKNKYAGVAVPRTDNQFDFEASIKYKLLRWLQWGGGYTYSKRTSNAVNTSYTQNILEMNLSGKL